MKNLFLKKFSGLCFLSISLLSATAAFAGRRETAVAARELSRKSAHLAQHAANTCGCPNTVAFMSRIAELATDIEVEARFGSKQNVIDPFKRIVKNSLTLQREYLPNVPNPKLRIDIKRVLGIYVNEIGVQLFGFGWIPVQGTISGQQAVSEAKADQIINEASDFTLAPGGTVPVSSDFVEPAESRDDADSLPGESSGSNGDWDDSSDSE